MLRQFNAGVYFRPRYKAARADYPSDSRVGSILRVLKISLPDAGCCCGNNSRQQSDEKGTGAAEEATKMTNRKSNERAVVAETGEADNNADVNGASVGENVQSCVDAESGKGQEGEVEVTKEKYNAEYNLKTATADFEDADEL